jgi:hypothetical protein
MLSFKLRAISNSNLKLLDRFQTLFEICCISLAFVTQQIANASENLYQKPGLKTPSL